MFLKKIKINGFKSFARPLVIKFNSPLTAIVGPNGSGKSNIVDAIRWALGEQSARTLRGSRMADVIFSGSRDYKPLHKASVTLYLDNSKGLLPLDTREVSICRQVDESGQSDYLLNGSSCRLKDIEDLLAGTGMGKDSYSVVGQGRIESILNSKPEKTRYLFEEAAGITRYKQRKLEAERRLEKTEHDLERIGDLVWELRKQAGPLKKAAEKARKYRRLKDELSRLEISYLLDRWDRNREEEEKLREERDLLSGKYSRSEQELAEIEENLQFTREGVKQEKKLLEDLKENYYQLKGKKEEAENNLRVLAERFNHLENEQARGGDKLIELEKDRQRLEEEEKRLEEEYRKTGGLAGETSRKLEETEVLLQEKKEALLAGEDRLESRKDLEYQLDRLQGKGQLFTEEQERIHSKLKQLEAESDASKQQVEKKSAEQEAIRREIEKTGVLRDEQGSEVERLSSELEAGKGELAVLVEEFNRTETQRQLLEEMEEDYRGYYPGVRAILKEGGSLPGIIGVVADLLKVSEKYELAVATALGARLQNIIVEDDRSARRGIEFLKEENRGRATFLPLNMMRGKRVELEQGIHPGLLGPAVDFVAFEKRLEPAVNYLLGDIIVARNQDDAVEITRRLNQGYKIVTLDGEFINTGGAITGGSDGRNKERLLARSRQIEELAEKSSALKAKTWQEKTRLEGIESELQQVQADRETAREQLHKLELELNKLQEIQAGLERDQERVQREIRELESDAEVLTGKMRENDSLQKEIIEKLKTYPARLKMETEGLKALEREIEGINSQLTELKIERATLKQREENLEMQRENISRRLEEIDAEEAATGEKIKKVEQELADLRGRKEKLLEMSEDFREEAALLQEIIEEKTELLDQLEGENNELEKRAGEKRTLYNQLKDEFYGVELKLTRLEDRNEQLAERLREEYRLEPDAPGVERIDINFTGVRKKIRELKSAIDNLGVVNQGAVEEYAELNARLEDLAGQNEDLTAARDAILEVIKDLEGRMSLRFAETFNQVKEEFTDIFQRLFEGGQARLELTDPDNMLETGVEIIAQPPGKQLKRLSLMSGGEKALTATALVFALLQVNPSPLYILDEIDAPLDDANVQRFSHFLKEYSREVQFLLITHNKNMMVETDTIYGVTMEESGVSKLISLRLDQDIA